MHHVHLCHEFQLETENLSNVRKKVAELPSVDSLRRMSTVTPYTGGIFVYRNGTPKGLTLLQEYPNLEVDGQTYRVLFARAFLTGPRLGPMWQRHKKLIKNGTWADNYPLAPDEIEDCKEEIRESNREVVLPKPELPESKTRWLKDFKLLVGYYVFESEEWVRYAQEKNAKDGLRDADLNAFRRVIDNIVQRKSKGQPLGDSGVLLWEDSTYDVAIFYNEEKKNDGSLSFNYFLQGGASRNSQKDRLEELKKCFTSKIDKRKPLRAYPAWALRDESLWSNIQRGSELSNLSLMPEQIDFLTKGFRFPKYIDAQAGSGKSTMLYYIFANLYYYHCAGEMDGPVVFLMENDELLEQSRKMVGSMLRTNPEFDGLSVRELDALKDHFFTFASFMRNQLNPEELENFPMDKYLDYPKFRYLYNRETKKASGFSSHSPEEAWFVINTLFRGYGYKEMNASNYEIFTRKIRLVSREKMEELQTFVKPWYDRLLQEDRFWDKTTIIRILSEQDRKLTKYEAIVCDEAQDFSRQELLFLISMSSFNGHDLSKVDQIPLVFAGDPNQTVNPTGFTAEHLKSMLFVVLSELGFRNLGKDYIFSPEYNYRSPQPVVDFANKVQLWRIKEFGFSSARKQDPGRPTRNERDINFFFPFSNFEEDPLLAADFITKIQNKNIIIPEELSPADRKKRMDEGPLKGLTFEVKTPMEVKGAEYEQVVLYDFGRYYMEEIDNQSGGNDELKFRRHFFFNKLYVSITRSKQEIIILDSKESWEGFWLKLDDVVDLSWNLKPMKEILRRGTELINLLAEVDEETGIRNAQTDFERGKFSRNPILLEAAARQFRRFDRETEALEASALAYELLEKYDEAIATYEKIKDLELARPKIIACALRLKQPSEMLERKIGMPKNHYEMAAWAVSQWLQDKKMEAQRWLQIQEALPKLVEIVEAKPWRGDLLKKLVEAESHDDWNRGQILERLIQPGDDYRIWDGYARLHFRLSNWKQAAEAWEMAQASADSKHAEAAYDESRDYLRCQVLACRASRDFDAVWHWLFRFWLSESTPEERGFLNEQMEWFQKQDRQANLLFEQWFRLVFGMFHGQISTQAVQEYGQVETLRNNQEEELVLIEWEAEALAKQGWAEIGYTFLLERWAKKHHRKYGDLQELNLAFQSIAARHAFNATPFTQAELARLPDVPKPLSMDPPPHFSHLEIRRFKKFDHLEIKDIGQFNLLVGDNNVGKTSLLEALCVSAEPAEPLYQWLFAWRFRNSALPGGPEEFFEDFWRDGLLKDPKTKERLSLEFIVKEFRRQWTVKIKAPEFSKFSDDQSGALFEFGVKKQEWKFEDSRSKVGKSSPLTCPLVPFAVVREPGEAEAYLELVDLSRSEREEFVEHMKTFVPKIQRISLSTSQNRIYIEESGQDMAAPLTRYGQGAYKLFRILLQMKLHQGKRLMIDEIDTGIHYTRFKEFWKIILRKAQQYQIQLFASTHNWECLEYFNEALNELRDEEIDLTEKSRVIQIHHHSNGKVKAYTHVFEQFNALIEDNFVSLRGGEL